MRKAAVIGCGDVSVVHFEAIAAMDGVELVGVCDNDPGRLVEASRSYGVPGFSTVDELVDGVGPEVVHITTPHHAHRQPAVDALARGVHVILEKPLAHTLAAARDIVDAAAGTSAKVGICFQNRYNAASQAMRTLLDSGELGELRGAYASVVWTRTEEYYRNRPWRGTWEGSGGGVLINQAIHTLDLVQWFLGGYDSLTGHAATNRYGQVIEVEDTAEALITHPGGIATSFYATLTAPLNRPVEVEIWGANGHARMADGLTVTWADGRVDVTAEREAPSGGRTYWGVSHELLIRDFYARIDDPEPFWISPREAMTSLRMLKDVYDGT